MEVAALTFALVLFQAAVAQAPPSDVMQLLASSGSQCAELAGELRKREADLEKQATRLEDERDEALREDGGDPDSAGVVMEAEEADPEVMEIEEELARLTQLAATSEGKPVYKNLMESIQHLKFQRHNLVGSKPDEAVKRQNMEIEAANRKIADVNARIQAYNALSMKFEEDVSKFKASCSAR